MGPSRQLPDRANLEHLRNEAKQRLKALRGQNPTARLTDAQLLVAREYGFPSWRQLKATVDDRQRERVFQAARVGDLETVRSALDGGFHPATTDASGRTLHQIAKTLGQPQIELLLREHQVDALSPHIRAGAQVGENVIGRPGFRVGFDG